MGRSLSVVVCGMVGCVAVSICGCADMKENGMLSPRSGELFQTTRMGPGKVTECCSALTVGGMFAFSEGRPGGLLIAIIGLPFAVPALVLDEMVVSPLTDIVCLPYDLSCPNHGFYIRIVDEDGKPVPGLEVSGGVGNRASEFDFFGTSISGKTDDSGEIYVSRLFNLKGGFKVRGSGWMPWFYSKDINLDRAKRESDGRIVSQYSARRCDVGEWKAKAGVSREEVLLLLPGKWSADDETRKYMKAEIGWPSTADSKKHCFSLNSDGSTISGVPGRYKDAHCQDNPWWGGDKLKVWQLTDRLDDLGIYDRGPSGWKWAIRLCEDVRYKWDQNVFFLGEDEKGVFLMPYFDCEHNRGVVLKFRKVTE